MKILKDALARPLAANATPFDLVFHVASTLDDLRQMISVAEQHGEQIKAILLDVEPYERSADINELEGVCLQIRAWLKVPNVHIVGINCTGSGSDSTPEGIEMAVVRPMKHGALQERILQALEIDFKLPFQHTKSNLSQIGAERFNSMGFIPDGVRKPESDSDDASVEPPQRSSLRVLLTEDNLVNQKVIIALLERLGISADLCSNGLEAVMAVQRTNYDIILMDLQMPVMSGIEAATRIRDLKIANPPIIIALTAATTTADRLRCLEVMEDYLSKPVSLRGLRVAFNKCLLASGRPALSAVSIAPARSESSDALLPDATPITAVHVQRGSHDFLTILIQAWAVAATAIALMLFLQSS